MLVKLSIINHFKLIALFFNNHFGHNATYVKIMFVL
jgi:hypothetical protein